MRLVALTTAWLAGIVAAAALPNGMVAPWLLLAAVALTLWLPRLRPTTGAAGLLVLLVALGGLRMTLAPASSDVRQWNGRGGMTLTGTVAAVPTVRDNGVSIPVDLTQVERSGAVWPSQGRVLVEAPAGTTASPGDAITSTGLLVRPSDGDRFSYADYLARRGIYSQLTQAFVRVTPNTAPLAPGRWLAQARASAQRQIAAALPEPYAALLSGIVLGDDSRIAQEVETAFAATGTAHILAISGFNMVVIAQVVSAALSRLGLTARKTALLSILFIGVYTLFVGAGPAIVRAALMSALLVVAPLVRRRAYVPASVALVGLALSLVDPFVLWDLGFQFSVAATLGLALFAQPIGAAVDRVLARVARGRTLAVLTALVSAPLAATLAAQITTAPISVLSFGALSLVLVPVNLLVLPAQPAILLLGGLAVVASFVFAPLGQLLFWAVMLPLGWTTSVVRAFAALPFAQVDASLSPTLATVYLLALGIAAVLEALDPGWGERVLRRVQQRALFYGGAAASTVVIVLAAALALARPDGQLHVHFLDVGHSNAVLIQTPGGAQMLVDGGRLPSRLLTALGDRMPFNDKTLEALIITQPDANEYEALAEVAARYDVALVLTNGQPNAAPAWTALRDRLAGATHRAVRRGETLVLSDGTQVDILNPATAPELDDSLDGGALALRVRYGNVSLLLTGDLSRDAQAQLRAGGTDLHAAVLQAPQHATARALDAGFLAAVDPQVVVVQSAADNRRGDPNADTLALFGSTRLFRTDQAGALHLWTDGVTLWVNGERRSGD